MHEKYIEQMEELVNRLVVGNSASVWRLRDEILKAGQCWAPVCISGETGVGKEVAAQAIAAVFNIWRRRHHGGKRTARAAPFIPVNCAGMPKDLAEAMLFGHAKGAYTGAIETRTGLIEEADGGCLLLDEIGDMPLAQQRLLLRFLDSGEIRPVGTTQRKHLQVKVITATNKDLRNSAARGLFREDLFYRLNVISLYIPPLRTRQEDISELADYFANKYGATLTAAANDALREYAWPGNARELKHAIERAAYMHGVDKNGIKNLNEEMILKTLYGSPEQREALFFGKASAKTEEDGKKAECSCATKHSQVRDIYNSMPADGALVGSRIREVADAVYGGLLLQTLVKHDFNFSAASKTLQMDRATMRRWLVVKGLHRPWMEQTGPGGLKNPYKE